MDRRGFLKNMFGAAVVMAMPKIVVNQIETLPEPSPASPVINGTTPIFKKKIIPPPSGLLYIWDDEKNELIGASNQFSLDFKQEYIDIREISVGFGFRQYYPTSRSWTISASNIQWVGDSVMDCFNEQRKLRCLIAKDNVKINGEIYITQLAFIDDMCLSASSEAEFEGSGELILEVS